MSSTTNGICCYSVFELRMFCAVDFFYRPTV